MIHNTFNVTIYLMKLDKNKYDKYISPRCSHINVGSGLEIAIRELAQKIKQTVGYRGEVDFDLYKPDGSPRKLMDSKTINSLGFKSQITLNEGLLKTYKDYLKLNANS